MRPCAYWLSSGHALSTNSTTTELKDYVMDQALAKGTMPPSGKF